MGLRMGNLWRPVDANGVCLSNPYAGPTATAPDPDPGKFKVMRVERVGNNLVLMVHYPDCTNFEGIKVMVYKGVTTLIKLLNETDGKLDPHFSASGPSPIARFRPDSFELAMAFAKTLL